LVVGLVLLFGCLSIIYSRVPHLRVPWRAVWPGALGATVAIGVVDYGFPLYIQHFNTIAQFSTWIVTVVIVLIWFYVLAVIILSGAIVNALRMRPPQPGD
jgi:membrane protein